MVSTKEGYTFLRNCEINMFSLFLTEQPIDDDEEDTTEIRFVPDNSGRLDQLYKAVQDCTLLHPDASSDMSESEDEDDDGIEQLTNE